MIEKNQFIDKIQKLKNSKERKGLIKLLNSYDTDKVFRKVHYGKLREDCDYNLGSVREHLRLFNELSNSKFRLKDFFEFENVKEIKEQEILKGLTMTKSTVERISNCANYYSYLEDEKMENKKLVFGNFCGNRFCPICAKRKSLKDFLTIKTLTEYLSEVGKYKFAFLTLTAPNVSGENLKSEITKYNNAFNRMFITKKYQLAFKGYIRKLEVTYNKNTNTFHPHFHVLCAVNKSYFTDASYIARNDILKDWQHYMKDKSITQVDIRRVKEENGKLDKAILEVTKYVAKDFNFLDYGTETFKDFYLSLKSKKIISFGGVFKDVKKMYDNNKILTPESDENIIEWFTYNSNTWNENNEEYEVFVCLVQDLCSELIKDFSKRYSVITKINKISEERKKELVAV